VVAFFVGGGRDDGCASQTLSAERWATKEVTVQINYSDECEVGELRYAVRADTDDAGIVRLQVIGTDADGVPTAEASLTAPAAVMVDTGSVLREAITGLGRLAPAGRRVRRSGAKAPLNSYKPWTRELSDQLRAAWLAEPQTASASALTGVLAKEHGRTRNSIRAQIAKVGCDPDVPGRILQDSDALEDSEDVPEEED
jgi:hypothetical protein